MMQRDNVNLLIFFILCSSHMYVSGHVYYITSNEDSPCPREPCMTLETFISNHTTNLSTTLIISAGNHSLSAGLVVSNVKEFSILSSDDTNEPSSRIVCNHRSYLNFTNVTFVNIRGLTFVGCGGNIVKLVELLTIQRSSFVGDSNIATSMLTSLTITNSNASISKTNFSLYQMGTYRTEKSLNLPISPNRQHASGVSITVAVGGAIITTHSTLSVDKCCFERNTANVGGAVYSEIGSNITISNSSFSFNRVILGQSEYCFGGALFTDGTEKMFVFDSNFESNTSERDGGMAAVINATLSLSNCSISHNTATRYGGAVAISQGSTFYSENTSFSHNMASESGGTLYAKESSSVKVSKNSTFISNSAVRYGGGMYLHDSLVTVERSMFRHNTAVSGGVVYATNDASIAVDDCDVCGNKAKHHGGVAYLTEHSKCVISSSNVWDNEAEHGGVVHARDSANITVNASFFSANGASLNGGVLETLYGGSILINGTFFHDNFANREGGVLYGLSIEICEVYQSNFTANKANIGGVFTIRDGSKFFSQDSIFYGNTDSDLGAVIYADNETDNTICDCKFINNTGNYGGVVHATRNSNVTVDNSTFDSNSAHIDSGTIYGRASSIIDITNSFLTNNSAVNDAVMLAFDASVINLVNVTFSNNKVGHDGGAVYVYDNSVLAISNCSFTSSLANNSGGAVYGRKGSIIIIEESSFFNCSAQNSGGGVYIQKDSNVTIRSSNFTNNSAYTGGALHVYARSNGSLANCNLTGNSAQQSGGVMNAYQFSNILAQACTFNFNQGGYGGLTFVFQGSIIILRDCKIHSNVGEFDGVIKLREQSVLIVSGSHFEKNGAESGGVVYAQDSNTTIEATSFVFNHAREKGGVIFTNGESFTSIFTSNFTDNSVDNDGGVMVLLHGASMIVESCIFARNSAQSNGGVVGIQEFSSLHILNTNFSECTAGSSGGVIRAINSSVSISNSSLVENSANKNGGIIDARSMSSIVIFHSIFLKNTAMESGGVVYLEGQSNVIVSSSIFQWNKAENKGGIILATMQSEICVTNCTFANSSAGNGPGGVILAEENSSISFVETCHSANEVRTIGGVMIKDSKALNGGCVHLSESDFFIGVNSSFVSNEASISGGGLYADSKSSVNINGTVLFENNRAIKGYGGAINAAQDTSITFGRTVNFVGNSAEFGGAISLSNSELYNTVWSCFNISVNFISNHANYGGALYVNDEDECSSSNATSCFLQSTTEFFRFNFYNNSASSTKRTRGSDLFGGLLDRCTSYSNINTSSSLLEQSGAMLFMEISNITNFDTVYSKPIRVCPCQNSLPNCSHSLSPIEVMQGNGFVVGPIAAVDQVGHPLAAKIVSAFTISDSGVISLPANQTFQQVDGTCSNLVYNVEFPSALKMYELTLYADGPCDRKGISEFTVDVHVRRCSCPRGFIRNRRDPACTCICDTEKPFSTYITSCTASNDSVIRTGRFWITYLSESNENPYFIYPYCPLDYCQLPNKPVSVNLNLPNGSDAQCDKKRSGILCGKCLPEYSLSLGSSRCLKCEHELLIIGIIIAAILAGLLLVVLLLALNLTVAVGTLNAIIFYANIIYVNRSFYFQQLPHGQLTFVPVVISWLNLDIGFDVCFYSGMDEYVKTWMQLAFPLYIIFLVFIIIWISSCSSRFSRLLGKRDPVATLATLILLSYTRLLETIVESLSFVRLKYPNQNHVTFYWLPDANVEYGKGKHIALVIAAVLILILGLVYTVLITSWQWLLYCSRLKFLQWTRNQKLHAFIDSYHIPHTAKSRYWTGLLLLVRVVIFLIATFSVSIDPRITLLSTAVIMSCLMSYKTILMIRVYKNRLLNALESYVYFNISTFALVTWYTFVDSSSGKLDIFQTVAAYLSAGTIIIIFILVISFHLYRYGNAKVYSMGQNSKFVGKVKAHLSYEEGRGLGTLLDNTIFDVMDSPRNGNSYRPPIANISETHTLPTRSEVSMTESQTLEYSESNDRIQSDSESPDGTQKWQQGIKNDENRRSKSLVEKSTFYKHSGAAVSKIGSRPLVLSYSAQESLSKSITVPLLEEDQL